MPNNGYIWIPILCFERFSRLFFFLEKQGNDKNEVSFFIFYLLNVSSHDNNREKSPETLFLRKLL